jgi:hypothetical protein
MTMYHLNTNSAEFYKFLFLSVKKMLVINLLKMDSILQQYERGSITNKLQSHKSCRELDSQGLTDVPRRSKHLLSTGLTRREPD